MLTTQTMLWMWKCLQRRQQILRYIRNQCPMETFWKHFHCKKVFARLPSSKYLLSGLFPYFSFPVQCQHIGRKWMYDQHRTQDISHIKLCKNISCNARLLWVSQEIHNGKWHIQLCSALFSPIFPSLPILINYVTKRFQFGVVTNHKGVIYTRGRKGWSLY